MLIRQAPEKDDKTENFLNSHFPQILKFFYSHILIFTLSAIPMEHGSVLSEMHWPRRRF